MPVYEGTREIEIDAPAEDVFAVLTDYERMPEWSSRIRECRVLEAAEDGLSVDVEYAIDAILRTVRYRLRHLYDRPSRIDSQYLSGDFRCFEGDYELRPSGRTGPTHVRFHLRIDPGLRVPGRIARMLNEQVMGRALEDLRRRVEEVGVGAA